MVNIPLSLCVSPVCTCMNRKPPLCWLMQRREGKETSNLTYVLPSSVVV